MIGYVTTYSGLTKSLAASLVETTTELGCSCQAMSAAGAMLLSRAQKAGELRPDIDICDVMLVLNVVPRPPTCTLLRGANCWIVPPAAGW